MITGTAFWYASRATGVVSLVLFSLVAILGILVNRQGRLPGLPRFAVTGLHRNLSLLTVAFLGMHIVTAIVDGYAKIPWLSTVVRSPLGTNASGSGSARWQSTCLPHSSSPACCATGSRLPSGGDPLARLCQLPGSRGPRPGCLQGPSLRLASGPDHGHGLRGHHGHRLPRLEGRSSSSAPGSGTRAARCSRPDSGRQDLDQQDREPSMTAGLRDTATSSSAATNPAPHGLPRLLSATGQPMDLGAHLQVHGPIHYRGGPRMLINTLQSAGLTGRGGRPSPPTESSPPWPIRRAPR